MSSEFPIWSRGCSQSTSKICVLEGGEGGREGGREGGKVEGGEDENVRSVILGGREGGREGGKEGKIDSIP